MEIIYFLIFIVPLVILTNYLAWELFDAIAEELTNS